MADRAPSPLAVVDIELAQPPPSLPGFDRGGDRTPRAWLLVRRWTEPIGTMVVDVPPEGLAAHEVAALVAQRFGAPDPSTVETQSVPPGPAQITVAICTRNRPEGLARALASLRAQTRPARRLLVVDSGAGGGAVLPIVAEAGAEYLAVASPGLARARNAAVRHCPGEVIAWLDDDEVADEHWLAQAERALREHPEADVICGAVVPAELRTPAQVWFEGLGGLVAGRGFTEATFGPATRGTFHPLYPRPLFGAGANMVTRPGVVERVGWFDPALGAGSPAAAGEDTLFFAQVLRAGGTVLYRPSLLTRHFHRREVNELDAQLRGYGRGLTAMYSALLRREPAALLSLLALAPRALRHLIGIRAPAAGELGGDVPPRLRRALRRGMAGGPLAYLRGAWR